MPDSENLRPLGSCATFWCSPVGRVATPAATMITGSASRGPWLVCDDRVITCWKRRPFRFRGRLGGSLVWWRHPLVVVGSDPVEVDRRLFAGEPGLPVWCGGAPAHGQLPGKLGRLW